MSYFQDVGDRIDAAWTRASRAEDAFAKIAERELGLSAPHGHTSVAAILDEFLSTATLLPRQMFRAFGQPPVNVFVADDFFIEANFWLDGTTSIHDHGFSGAFCVLEGSSLHASYTFTEDRALSPGLASGILTFLGAEKLTPGVVRLIHLGGSFIHSLFHLERPTVSIVARTNGVSARRALEYLSPGLRIDSAHKPQPLRTRLELLDVLGVSAPGAWAERAAKMARECPATAFEVLRKSAFCAPDAWKQVCAQAIDAHGEVAGTLVAAILEAKRVNNLVARRAEVQDAELRYFLALLLNVPTRGQIDALLRAAYGNGSPEERIVGFLSTMSKGRKLGLTLEGVALDVLRALLRGQSLPGTLASIGEIYGHGEIARNADLLATVYADLASASALRPLFTS